MRSALPILEVRDLQAGYGAAQILHGVSLSVQSGGFVAVIGPNGAGKSTLLKAIYGLVSAPSGSVALNANGSMIRINERKTHELTALGMNYVPQLANVFPNMSVLENLEVSATLERRRRRARIGEILDLFPVLAARRRQRAGTLSGGERKMLALGRALVTEPRLLLLDEPSAGLSPSAVGDVFDKLTELHAAGISILVVEQNARRSLAVADYGFVLEMGRNRFEGPGPSLLNNPRVVDLYLGGPQEQAKLEG